MAAAEAAKAAAEAAKAAAGDFSEIRPKREKK